MPPQEQSERVRLKGPDGKVYTIPSTQAGAFLRVHPDYDVAPVAAAAASSAGPSTYDRLTSSGYDPKLESFDKAHPIAGKAARFFSSVGGTVLGMPGAIYHAATDPATEEETKAAGGPEEVSGAKRIGLALGRLTGAQQIEDAAKFYAPAFGFGTEEDRKQLNQADLGSVLPEALGQGVGTVAGAEIGGEAVRGATRGVKTGLRVAAQEMGGAGREGVLRENLRHQEAVADARAKYQKAVEDYRNSEASAKAAHAEKVKAARQEWVDKSAAARRSQAEARASSSQKQTLARGQETYSSKLRDNIQRTYNTVKSRLDARWHHLRETPVEGGKLRDLPLDSTAIADAIENARQTKLVGSPDSLKQFNDLMGWMTDKSPDTSGMIAQEAGGTKPALRPITWDEARVHYSALGDRMFSGDLPGNVLQAVREVRNVLDSQLNRGAMHAGVQDIYSGLKRDWSNFESDWKDMSSITTRGGSPLARARMAPNAATLTPQLVGKTGDLLLQRLAKYKDAGASIPLAEGVRKLGKQLEEVPTVRPTKAPGKLELPPKPKPTELPELKLPEAPDPTSIRRNQLLLRAGRPMSWWDLLFPPAGIEHLALKNPKLLESIARQPRNEIPVPESDMEMALRRAPIRSDLEGRLKQVAKPQRDTNILAAVRAEHPEWSLSEQLQEAARRTKGVEQ